MTDTNRVCIVCGKPLPESVSKNALTHPGACRDANTQSLLTNHNKRVKSSRIRSIVEFLEERFDATVDSDSLVSILSTIHIYHTTIEDFVMTAYYLMAKDGKRGVTIRDIIDAANDWDERHGGKRTALLNDRARSCVRSLGTTIDTTELSSILKRETWRSDVSSYVARTIKSVTDPSVKRLLGRLRSIAQQKFGYNKTAYNTLKQHIDVSNDDTMTTIRSIISTAGPTMAMESDRVDDAIHCHDKHSARLLGRDPVVIAGGILYHIAQRHGLGISQETISATLNVSTLSIRKVYTVLTEIDG